MTNSVEKGQASYVCTFPAEVVLVMELWQAQKGVIVSVLANSGERLFGLFVNVPTRTREVQIEGENIMIIQAFIEFCREKSNEIVIKPKVDTRK